MTNNNLWLYSSGYEQHRVADSMLLFGADLFKTSKVVSEIDKLSEVLTKFGSASIPVQIQKDIIIPFAFSHLIDSIKIIIFFENYMKSELLRKDFLIHKLTSDEKYKALRKQQEKRPVKLTELDNIKKFNVIVVEKYISHSGVATTTLGFNDLIRKEAYCVHYKFDDSVRKILMSLNENRNRLHLYESIDFSLSCSFINDLKKLIDFVDSVIKRN